MGEIGPDLTHFGSRLTIASNALHKGKEGVTFTEFFDNPTKDPELINLKRWLQHPPEVKPGSLMPALGITDDEADILADFLENLK